MPGEDHPSQYDVKAELGKKKDGAATFTVIIQNRNDKEFSYRPKSLWAEVVPLFPGGKEGQPYTFHDLCFVNGCEVPKLEFRACGWPPKADNARISLWFKFSPVPGDEFSLDDDHWKKTGDDANPWKEFKLHGTGS